MKLILCDIFLGEWIMSGHSKWSSIKHKKAAVDSKRGRVFTRITKEITVAARAGGGDPAANPRLRTAVQSAKSVNMPQENIQRAIKKGTGELPGVHYEEHTYEGYGAAGVAIMAEVLTDNKNRTVAELRKIFSKNGGNMAESGCVNWMFHKKGLILVDSDKTDEEKLMSVVVDAGAEDIKTEEKTFEIITAVEDFENVKKVLETNKIEFAMAEITMIPETALKVEGKEAHQVLKLMEALEDHDDIQKTYANFDVSEKDLGEPDK
tara:strand:+ start:466 stop:1257 length:792 start_codon:yes stop_codon:yes gene_type:complete